MVKPASESAPALRAHFRYPEDQFKVQRELLTRYHVANPSEFYSTVSFWDVPVRPDGAEQHRCAAGPAAAVLPGRPERRGQTGPTFQLTSALVSLKRPFLSAYVSASSDPQNYGKITVLQLPVDTQTPGPQQMQNAVPVLTEREPGDQPAEAEPDDDRLRQPADAAGGRRSALRRADLHRTCLVRMPSFPQLARVLVGYGGRVGYSANLQTALDQVFGAGAGSGVRLPRQARRRQRRRRRRPARVRLIRSSRPR